MTSLVEERARYPSLDHRATPLRLTAPPRRNRAENPNTERDVLDATVQIMPLSVLSSTHSHTALRPPLVLMIWHNGNSLVATHAGSKKIRGEIRTLQDSTRSKIRVTQALVHCSTYGLLFLRRLTTVQQHFSFTRSKLTF